MLVEPRLRERTQAVGLRNPSVMAARMPDDLDRGVDDLLGVGIGLSEREERVRLSCTQKDGRRDAVGDAARR